MSKRVRWYYVNIPIETAVFFDKLHSARFKEDSEEGFITLNESSSVRAFRFFIKKSVRITSVDSEGNQSFSDISTLKNVDFTCTIVEGKLFVRVENPNHSLKDLFNTFEKISGIGFYVKALSVKFGAVIDLLPTNYHKNITSIKVSNVVVSPSTIAKVELSSIDNIDIDKVDMLSGRKYDFENATLDLSIHGKKSKLELNKSGLVKLSGALEEELLHMIERYLIHSAF